VRDIDDVEQAEDNRQAQRDQRDDQAPNEAVDREDKNHLEQLRVSSGGARSRILHYSPTDAAAQGNELNRRKRYALALLAAITLVTPIVETLMTGRVEPFSNFDLGGSFLSLLPIYWWYHLDKDETGYRAGPLLNVGVAALAIVALPVYFVRSRGWKRGGVISLYALGALGVLYLLETLGEVIGEAIAGIGGRFI
jgi:hypothetical protein